MSEDFSGILNVPDELDQSMQENQMTLHTSHKKPIDLRHPFMRLPAEVWMYIFEFVCLAGAFRIHTRNYLASLKRTRLVLTSTCISWRLIARRTRSLWSPLLLNSPVSATGYDGLAAQIGIVANRPFEIIFDDRKYVIYMNQIQGIQTAFKRCRTLSAHVTADEWETIYLAFQSPHLTCVNVEWSPRSRDRPDALDFREATALQHLSLYFGNRTEQMLKLPDNSQIVHLSLTGSCQLEVSNVITLLNSCPSLETLVLTTRLDLNQPLTQDLLPLVRLRNVYLDVAALPYLAKPRIMPNMERFKLSVGAPAPPEPLDLSLIHT